MVSDTDKWVATENISQFRKRLSEPLHEAQRQQLEGLLARELVKLQTRLPDKD
jgi:hypothetical protein